MKYLTLTLFVFILLSCSKRTHTFRGKKVTERQFNKRLHKYTVKFINNNPEFVDLWKDVQVVYDTTKTQ
jgi:hypothetical protein